MYRNILVLNEATGKSCTMPTGGDEQRTPKRSKRQGHAANVVCRAPNSRNRDRSFALAGSWSLALNHSHFFCLIPAANQNLGIDARWGCAAGRGGARTMWS